MVRTRFALILYFRMVAHKAACHTLSKAFLKSMKTWYRFYFLACLYESTESYCCHFDVGIGVAAHFKVYILSILNFHISATTSQKHLICETSHHSTSFYFVPSYPRVTPGIGLRGKKLGLTLKFYDNFFLNIHISVTTGKNPSILRTHFKVYMLKYFKLSYLSNH